jgi:predicted enzyme related to lactoylglutathione lyase
MSTRSTIPGKFTWFELVTKDPKKAQAFYAEVLGWRVQSYPMGAGAYDMICVGDTMIGGYAPTARDVRAHFIGFVSVEDVDGVAAAAAANGGKVIEKPSDIPNVGRRATIADPQGAEMGIFKSSAGDPPDAEAPNGAWCWNELHTTDVAGALAFYERVLGFAHAARDMGPAGTYHILSRGGVDRGGATSHLPPGARPLWLPYVAVDDVDATAARAKTNGGIVSMGPEDVPGVGRIGALEDPTGAALGMIKPLPRLR